MANNNYQRGANRERKWVKDAYAAGAIYAGRFAGSHGAIDTVAIYKGKIVMCQIKTGKGRVDKVEETILKYIAEQVKEVKVPITVELHSYPGDRTVRVKVY